MDTDSAYMAIAGDSFESLIKPELREEFEKDKHNCLLLQVCPKENLLPASLKSSLRETKSLTFAVSLIAWKNFHLIQLQVKSSSL